MAITVLGNVGNQGYALPMVQAYPLDVNSQYMLAWNPVQQALDYIPYVGNVLGDFGVTRDLSVTRNATVGGTLSVTGVASFPGGIGPVTSSGAISATGFNVGGTAVVGARKAGWAVATGTVSRATFDTATVTLPELAARVAALETDLIAHGLIGA